jgi:hypothetical protein
MGETHSTNQRLGRARECLMAEKKDILGDLLTGTDQATFSGLEELNGLIALSASPVSRRRVSRNRLREDSSEKTIKKKATHYFSPDTLEGITRMLPEIHRIISGGVQKRLSKSQLVDASMQLLLLDFEEKEEGSLLVQHILKT